MAEESVNVDDAQSVGEKILTSMVGHSVSEYKFSHNNQVKTLASAMQRSVNIPDHAPSPLLTGKRPFMKAACTSGEFTRDQASAG